MSVKFAENFLYTNGSKFQKLTQLLDFNKRSNRIN